MKLKSCIVAVIVVAVIFGGIAGSAALNLWRTTSNKQPAKIASGEFAGQNNRDFCADNGVEFSQFKVTLQEKVDSIE